MSGFLIAGPKRIELRLKNIGGVVKEEILIVTELSPPNTEFKSYSVRGRMWSPGMRILKKEIDTMWSSHKWISQMETYQGGSGGSTVEHFTPQNQKQAWLALEGKFYALRLPELTVIRNWTPDIDFGIRTSIPHSQSWTQRCPPAYQPDPPK